jgi:hypothetical protein
LFVGGLDGTFDTILIASGILAPSDERPEKSLAEIDALNMARVLAVNAIGPALVLRHLRRLLPRNGRSVGPNLLQKNAYSFMANFDPTPMWKCPQLLKRRQKTGEGRHRSHNAKTPRNCKRAHQGRPFMSRKKLLHLGDAQDWF